MSWGVPDPNCTHWWRHTVYGSPDPAKNGTTCVLCGIPLNGRKYQNSTGSWGREPVASKETD